MIIFNENFWIAVSFIIFLYFAYKPVKKAILNSLDARIREIKDKLAQTEQLKKEAKALLAEIRQEMNNFEEYKKQLLDKAQASTEKLVESRAKEMQIALEQKGNSAILLIENEKAKIFDQLKDEFTDNVVNLVKAYLVKTKNNSLSDEEIVSKFIGK